MSDYTSQVGEFKGHKTFTISKGEKRVITVGVAKAKAILACLEELKEFIKESENNVAIDLNKLSPEQAKLIQSFIQR